MQELDELYGILRFTSTTSYRSLVLAVERVLTLKEIKSDIAFMEDICKPVAKECKTNGKAVQKRIRIQLDKCWDNPQMRDEICRVCHGGCSVPERPTPASFVLLLADYVSKVREREQATV